MRTKSQHESNYKTAVVRTKDKSRYYYFSYIHCVQSVIDFLLNLFIRTQSLSVWLSSKHKLTKVTQTRMAHIKGELRFQTTKRSDKQTHSCVSNPGDQSVRLPRLYRRPHCLGVSDVGLCVVASLNTWRAGLCIGSCCINYINYIVSHSKWLTELLN